MRAKDAEVPDQLEEDLTDLLKIKSDELDEVQIWIGTNNDAVEAVSRLEELEEFYSSLDYRYVEAKREKLEAIEHLKRIAKRKESSQKKPLAAEEESESVSEAPTILYLELSMIGCKGALAWAKEQLRAAEKSLASARDIVNILNDEVIQFLKLCQERNFLQSDDKIKTITANAGRLRAVLKAPLKAIEGLTVSLPDVMKNLEVDLAETMLAEFARILEYYKTLNLTKKHKEQLDGFYECLAKFTSFIPHYRMYESHFSQIIRLVNETTLDQLRSSPDRLMYISQLDDIRELLKGLKIKPEKSKPITRRIIQLKINLSKDLP